MFRIKRLLKSYWLMGLGKRKWDLRNPNDFLKSGSRFLRVWAFFGPGGGYSKVGEPLTVKEEYEALWKWARLDTNELARLRNRGLDCNEARSSVESSCHPDHGPREWEGSRASSIADEILWIDTLCLLAEDLPIVATPQPKQIGYGKNDSGVAFFP